MDLPGTVRPEQVVISRRVADTLTMATLLAGCLAAGTAVVAIFATDFAADPSVISALFLGLGVPLLLGANLFVAAYWTRVASRATFGEGISVQTLTRRRRYAWSDLGRMVVREQGLPVPSRCVVKLVFTDGRRYVVFANRRQGASLYRLADRQPWSRGWAGAPLPRAEALTLVGLGVVAILLGVLIVCDPVVDIVRNGLGRNRSGIQSDDLGNLAVAAVVVPLAGVAGVVAGAYHLVRRPVVIRPGVDYLREGQSSPLG
jgi:hypothetical protein